eukprot:755416-Prorocentrum_minimum.AAC.1
MQAVAMRGGDPTAAMAAMLGPYGHNAAAAAAVAAAAALVGAGGGGVPAPAATSKAKTSSGVGSDYGNKPRRAEKNTEKKRRRLLPS